MEGCVGACVCVCGWSKEKRDRNRATTLIVTSSLSISVSGRCRGSQLTTYSSFDRRRSRAASELN